MQAQRVVDTWTDTMKTNDKVAETETDGVGEQEGARDSERESRPSSESRSFRLIETGCSSECHLRCCPPCLSSLVFSTLCSNGAFELTSFQIVE